MPVCALTIAGSDPSGGAGIQQDLKVFAALGVAGLSAITAITVQNSQGVRSVHPVDADVLYRQIEAVLEDSKVDAVKIGMLGGAEQVQVVSEALRKFRPRNVVLDPVLASTDGNPLLDEAGVYALLHDLFPLCDLITPNIPELQQLTDSRVDFFGFREQAVKKLRDMGAKSVLVKGGHLRRSSVDALFTPSGAVHRFMGSRLETSDTHGTGCMLSAAICAGLAGGATLTSSVGDAKKLVTEGLKNPVCAGQERGYPDVFEALRRVEARKILTNENHTRRCIRLIESWVYVVTDSELRPDRSHEQIVTGALAGGARAIQLRDKRLSTPGYVDLARRLVSQVQEVGGILIVNDRVDVTLAANADGVHLGPDDMLPEDARAIMGPEKLIGVSVGTLDEAHRHEPYASYFGVGAVYGSNTKSDAGPPVGVEQITQIRKHFRHQIPVVAIGGINEDNISDVAAAGADAAAVVSAVVCADDMELAVRELRARFEQGNKRR